MFLVSNHLEIEDFSDKVGILSLRKNIQYSRSPVSSEMNRAAGYSRQTPHPSL